MSMIPMSLLWVSGVNDTEISSFSDKLLAQNSSRVSERGVFSTLALSLDDHRGPGTIDAALGGCGTEKT